MFFSAVRATVAQPGRMRFNSQARRAAMITFCQMVFAFLLATISRLPSIPSETRTLRGVRAAITSLRARSGTPTGVNEQLSQAQFSFQSHCDHGSAAVAGGASWNK